MSAIKEERVEASKKLTMNADASKALGRTSMTPRVSSRAVGKALYCAKICSYAQGFQLLRARASTTSGT